MLLLGAFSSRAKKGERKILKVDRPSESTSNSPKAPQ
ncbi:Protein kinase domain-containing protein [Psidium guajava]|nr:Protein kinase domain-containing protein [Psidium guajava]